MSYSCLATPLRFLPVIRQELELSTVLKSGQSFRWHKSTPIVATATTPDSKEDKEGVEWALGWGERTVVLRQDDEGVHYRSLYPFKPPHTAYLADLTSDTTRTSLIDYFQLSTPLAPLYSQWRQNDVKFDRKLVHDEKLNRLRGIRVLKQDEFETLVSFICSANNNIPRITLMVNRLCAHLGDPLPHPSHFNPQGSFTDRTSFEDEVTNSSTPSPPPNDLSLYSFPPPESLTAPSTESLLRQLGFGYRANFIPYSANLLISTAQSLSISPQQYLESLRRDRFGGSLEQAREELLKFKGVGRKVADCILLFGLGWSETVPVDTHVFQIAIRDYAFPSTKTTSLTPQLHDRVSHHLSQKWSPHAGWCQQILFFADLKSQSSGSGTDSTTSLEMDYKVKIEREEDGEEEEKVRKNTFEEDVKELLENPGRKRRRTTTTTITTTPVNTKKRTTKALKVDGTVVKVEEEPKVVVEGEGTIEGIEIEDTKPIVDVVKSEEDVDGIKNGTSAKVGKRGKKRS